MVSVALFSLAGCGASGRQASANAAREDAAEYLAALTDFSTAPEFRELIPEETNTCGDAVNIGTDWPAPWEHRGKGLACTLWVDAFLGIDAPDANTAADLVDELLEDNGVTAGRISSVPASFIGTRGSMDVQFALMPATAPSLDPSTPDGDFFRREVRDVREELLEAQASFVLVASVFVDYYNSHQKESLCGDPQNELSPRTAPADEFLTAACAKT
ncbi:hypothetical protein [Mycetocola zhadangensis]|uniref:hypothetical protein n=1 Tax=Mycetocola zhadangensis TaxID=1164595 RepID=UPI0011C443AA|nr:hypothetical protein [Mycetocola zhadangensis]